MIHKNNFVTLDKKFLQDIDLSWEAKGVLAYLFSLPPDSDVNTNELVKHGPDDVDVVESAIKELISMGIFQNE